MLCACAIMCFVQISKYSLVSERNTPDGDKGRDLQRNAVCLTQFEAFQEGQQHQFCSEGKIIVLFSSAQQK